MRMRSGARLKKIIFHLIFFRKRDTAAWAVFHAPVQSAMMMISAQAAGGGRIRRTRSAGYIKNKIRNTKYKMRFEIINLKLNVRICY